MDSAFGFVVLHVAGEDTARGWLPGLVFPPAGDNLEYTPVKVLSQSVHTFAYRLPAF